MSLFSRLRHCRHLLVLVALVWLPLNVYAQVCTTHVAVAAIGGAQHPGMPQPGDHEFAAVASSAATVVVVDADTFWRTIDQVDSACDMKALCAFAALAAVAAGPIEPLHPPQVAQAVALTDSAFRSRATSPDLPPPRLTL
jgi:hypothetical protein